MLQSGRWHQHDVAGVKGTTERWMLPHWACYISPVELQLLSVHSPKDPQLTRMPSASLRILGRVYLASVIASSWSKNVAKYDLQSLWASESNSFPLEMIFFLFHFWIEDESKERKMGMLF